MGRREGRKVFLLERLSGLGLGDGSFGEAFVERWIEEGIYWWFAGLLMGYLGII